MLDFIKLVDWAVFAAINYDSPEARQLFVRGVLRIGA